MSGGERMWGMDPTARFPENLRRLAIIEDGFLEDQAWLGRALDTALALDHKTAALRQLGASVAAGSPGALWLTGYAVQLGDSRKKADVVTNDERGDRRTAVLRHQRAASWTAAGRRLHPDALEIICSECGDDPGRGSCQVAPELRRVRGPYPIRTDMAAYRVHLSLHHPGRDGFPAGAITDAG